MTWTLGATDVTLEHCDATSFLEAESLPVHLACEAVGQPLQLFDAALLSGASIDAEQQPPEDAAAEPSSKATPNKRKRGKQEKQPTGGAAAAVPQRDHYALETVFYTGGTVWSMDWCPLPPRILSTAPTVTPAGPDPSCHLSASSSSSSGPREDLLAVSAHPKTNSRNKVGKVLSGPGAIQLWSLAVCSSTISPAALTLLPKLRALLLHEGRVAWDVKWCPDPSYFLGSSRRSSSRSTRGAGTSRTAAAAEANEGPSGDDYLWFQERKPDSLPIQGLLAALLGNGDVVVYAVPTLPCLTRLQQERASLANLLQGIDPNQNPSPEGGSTGDPTTTTTSSSSSNCLGLQLRPLVQLRLKEDMLGSLASCCEWCPEPPHDKLLVGCWDGRVLVWQLPQSLADPPQRLLYLAASRSPLRAVAWRPHQPEGAAPRPISSAPAPSPTISSSKAQPWRPLWFATGAQSGEVSMWDSSSCDQPVLKRVGGGGVMTVVWSGEPETLVWAVDMGELKQQVLDMSMLASVVAYDRSVSFLHTGDNPQCIWSIDVCPTMPVYAFVGDSGVIGVATVDPMCTDMRNKVSHAALGAIVVKEGEVWLPRPDQIVGNAGLQWGGRNQKPSSRKEGVAAAVPHVLEALYAVRFTRNTWGTTLLASGGAAGLVRVQRVVFDALVGPISQ